MLTLGKKISILAHLISDTLDETVSGPLYCPGRYLAGTFADYPKPRSYKTTVSRLVKTGQLTKVHRHGELYYQLTKLEGTASSSRRSQAPWDGNWLMVVYDVPEAKRSDRDVLRKKLKSLGFGYWQKSTWVSPFGLTPKLEEFLAGKNFVGRVSVFTARQLYGLTNQQVALSAWPLSKLNQQYREIVNLWRQALKAHPRPSQSLEKTGREILMQYLNVEGNDPHLPAELLPPDFAGTAARQTARAIVRRLAFKP